MRWIRRQRDPVSPPQEKFPKEEETELFGGLVVVLLVLNEMNGQIKEQ